MTKLAPEWVRTSDQVIRSPVRYLCTTAPADSLSWTNHISNVNSKISRGIFVVKQSTKCLPFDSLITLLCFGASSHFLWYHGLGAMRIINSYIKPSYYKNVLCELSTMHHIIVIHRVYSKLQKTYKYSRYYVSDCTLRVILLSK